MAKRWEVDYNGALVWQESASSSRNRGRGKAELIKGIFERDGWACEVFDDNGKFITVKLNNSNTNENIEYNVALVNVVNEYRNNSDNPDSNSSYEKRIQGQDLQQIDCPNKLVFGLYAIEEAEEIEKSIIVSWPEEILTSGSNRAYRVNTKVNIQPARLVGLYADQNSAYNVVTFKPENIYLYLKNRTVLHRYNNVMQDQDGDSEVNHTNEDNNNPSSSPTDKSYNRILFGAPGTGKSYKLDEERELYFLEKNYDRVTIHPNYSYAHFVGTYKPAPLQNDDTIITYKFVPGPFLSMWVKAYRSIQNQDGQKYLLILEEINRANVAAIFGDIFQLLDRKNGESEYPIFVSEDIKRYLHDEFSKDIPENNWYRQLQSEEKKKHITTMKLYPNMYLWSTMNSADQGVFPIDTAFKRRWNFEYIGINLNESKNDHDVTLANGEVVAWNDLRRAINRKLGQMNINEDKMIGPFFLNGKDVKDNFNDAFKNKLLMYLYEDVIKHKRNEFFKDGINNYSELLESYDRLGGGIFNFKLNYKSDESEVYEGNSTYENEGQEVAETQSEYRETTQKTDSGSDQDE